MKSSYAIALIVALAIVILLIWQTSQNATQLDPQLIQQLNGNRSLARQLQDAVKGNKSLAKRLLEQAQFKYPDKSDRWYVEKIIYDLERDGAGSGRVGASRNRVEKRELRENLFLLGSFVWLITALSSLLNGIFRRY
jgi:hypothetical protein